MIKALENFTYYLEDKPLQIYSGSVVSLPEGDEAFLISEGRAEVADIEGGGDPGYSVVPGWKTLFDGDITTTEIGLRNDYTFPPIDLFLDSSKQYDLRVTFDGTEYLCHGIYDENEGETYYGAGYNYDLDEMDWSEYPFSIWPGNYTTTISTETAGTFSLKVENYTETVVTEPSFKMAVQSVGSMLVNCQKDYTVPYADQYNFIDKSYNELLAAVRSGILPYCIFDLNENGGNWIYRLDRLSYSESGSKTTYHAIFLNASLGNSGLELHSEDPDAKMTDKNDGGGPK